MFFFLFCIGHSNQMGGRPNISFKNLNLFLLAEFYTGSFSLPHSLVFLRALQPAFFPIADVRPLAIYSLRKKRKPNAQLQNTRVTKNLYGSNYHSPLKKMQYRCSPSSYNFEFDLFTQMSNFQFFFEPCTSLHFNVHFLIK